MDAALSAGLAKGLTLEAIASQLGMSKNAVLGRKHRLFGKGPAPRRSPVRPTKQEPSQAPVNRDPCWRCGVRADFGCVHSRDVA
jgi:hypothetical protein